MAGTLTTVTLTGADDRTDRRQLAQLSESYPFVEWGILIGSHQGQPRFPSLPWIDSLIGERCNSGNKMKLSLHICGKYLREILEGRSSLIDQLGPQICAFDRCQLNFHGMSLRQGGISDRILAAFCNLTPWEPEIIFQLDGVNHSLSRASRRRFACSGLFDLSHGSGVHPDEWPMALDYMPCGWAGGLGPENIDEEIPRIAERAYGPFWIDMETRLRSVDASLRSDVDEFDLNKCRFVLDLAEQFVGTTENK